MKNLNEGREENKGQEHRQEDKTGRRDRNGTCLFKEPDPTEAGSGPALPSSPSTDGPLPPLPRVALEGGHG